MKTILILNQKGGVGKSLIADEIAFSFERAGVKTSFYDLDAQGGTIHKTRTVEDAEIQVIDTPGALQKNLDAWLKGDENGENGADIVIIPTLTSSREIEPLIRMIKAVDRYPDIKTMIVVNGYDRFRLSRDFMSWLSKTVPNKQILTLPRYQDFAQAGCNGISVVEYAPKSKATKAIKVITNAVKEAVGFETED